MFRQLVGWGTPRIISVHFQKGKGTMYSVMNPAWSPKEKKGTRLWPQSPTLFHPLQALFGPLAPCAPSPSTFRPPGPCAPSQSTFRPPGPLCAHPETLRPSSPVFQPGAHFGLPGPCAPTRGTLAPAPCFLCFMVVLNLYARRENQAHL